MTSLLGSRNALLTATLSAGSTAPGMAATNLQGQQGCAATAWQTAAGTLTSYVLADANSTTQRWRAFGLFRTNLSSAATVRIRVGSVADMTSGVVYDSTALTGVVAGYGQYVNVAPAEITGRYCRIDVSDSNTDGFLNIPLAYAGPVWQPLINFDYASSTGRSSVEAVAQSRSGVEYVTHGYAQRSVSLSYSGLAESEVWSDLMPLIRTSRSGTNLLVIPETNASGLQRQSVFGRLRTVGDVGYDRSGEPIRAWRGQIVERVG